MPVRSKSASLRASTLSLLLPSFNKALRRGLQTTTSCTCGCSRSYSQAAQVPSSQVTCSSPRRPWRNCRMLLPLVSRMVSMTSFPLPFRTAITIASLCTSIPIYMMSRLIAVASSGGRHSCPRLSFPQGKVPSSSRFAYPSCTSFPPHTPLQLLCSGGPGLRSGQSGKELVLAKAFLHPETERQATEVGRCGSGVLFEHRSLAWLQDSGAKQWLTVG